MRTLVVGLVALGACGNKKPNDEPPPPAQAPPQVTATEAEPATLDIPDPHTTDWTNASYDIGELGVVKVLAGHANFRVAEDTEGRPVITTTVKPAESWPGSLDVSPPVFDDLDGDGHDEAIIAFDLKSGHDEEAAHLCGVYVFTLRDGVPIKLATIVTGDHPHLFKVANKTITTATGSVWRWDPERKLLVETH